MRKITKRFAVFLMLMLSLTVFSTEVSAYKTYDVVVHDDFSITFESMDSSINPYYLRIALRRDDEVTFTLYGIKEEYFTPGAYGEKNTIDAKALKEIVTSGEYVGEVEVTLYSLMAYGGYAYDSAKKDMSVLEQLPTLTNTRIEGTQVMWDPIIDDTADIYYSLMVNGYGPYLSDEPYYDISTTYNYNSRSVRITIGAIDKNAEKTRSSTYIDYYRLIDQVFWTGTNRIDFILVRDYFDVVDILNLDVVDSTGQLVLHKSLQKENLDLINVFSSTSHYLLKDHFVDEIKLNLVEGESYTLRISSGKDPYAKAVSVSQEILSQELIPPTNLGWDGIKFVWDHPQDNQIFNVKLAKVNDNGTYDYVSQSMTDENEFEYPDIIFNENQRYFFIIETRDLQGNISKLVKSPIIHYGKNELQLEGASAQDTYMFGETVTLEATIPNGKRFVKWESNLDLKIDLNQPQISFKMPGEKLTLKAVFEDEASYVLEVDGVTQLVLAGTNITLSAPKKEGELFQRWQSDYDFVLDLTQTDISFTMPNKNVSLKTIYKAYPEILEAKLTDTFTVKIKGELSDFKYVKVNDEVLSVDHYTLKQGSVILTLHKDYIASLKEGTYQVEIAMGDVHLKTNFVIQATHLEEKITVETLPQTGSSSQLVLSGYLLLVGALLIELFVNIMKTD